MKQLLVTGSVAFDRIAVFKDHFKNHILPEKTHVLNVAFTVDNMTVHFGGTGGNIAYNLALLGETPVLAGTVGNDIGEYRVWLQKNNIRLDWLKQIPDILTAQATVITDLSDNQITAFYAGAMARSHEARLEGLKDIGLGIVAPNGKEGMLYYAEYLRQNKIPFIADPGQAIPAFSGEELLQLLKGAEVLIVNDYEWSLIQEKLRITNDKLRMKFVNNIIVTYGEKGSQIWSRGQTEAVQVVAIKPKKVIDPTGCGDAYRAGVMYGLKCQWPLPKAARLGAWLASKAVARSGTQNHVVKADEKEEFLKNL